MHFEGDERAVLRQVAEHAHSIRHGKVSPHRPWLIACPGTMRGVYGGGQVSAFEERGLTNGFAGCVGVSTGAPTVAYFLAGQARLGTSIYYEECTWPEFISPLRILRGGHGADIGFLGEVFRGHMGRKRLAQERLHATSTELLFGLTEFVTGQGAIVNGKTVQPDVVHGRDDPGGLFKNIASLIIKSEEAFFDDGFFGGFLGAPLSIHKNQGLLP